MSISYKTPASFANFSCLGGECEDTCCRNWEVKLDKKHFDLLKKVTNDNKSEKEIFEQNIRLNDKSISSDYAFSFVSMRGDGYCTMLDDNKLCSIHTKYGEDFLGNVCAMYPRIISRCGDMIELSGSLSCPEVARNCINDIAPLKLKRFKPADLPRSKDYPIQRELSNLENDFYSENFDLVRTALMQTMANEDQTLETRLYAIANMANKISSFYHRGCSELPENQLESIFADLSEAIFVSKLDTFINDYDASSNISMIVVHSILSIKLQQANNENISQLYENIINTYNAKNENIAEVLAEELVKIRITIDDGSQQYIDKAITRYIINCLYREWFISMPDPFTYVQMLLVRTSILRTLIYLEVGHKKDLDFELLNKRIVYIVYNFARNFDQNLEFLKVVYNALTEQMMMNFDYSPAFIRIY